MKINKRSIAVVSILVFSIVVDIDILMLLCTALSMISLVLVVIYAYAFIMYKRFSKIKMESNVYVLAFKRLIMYDLGEEIIKDKFIFIRYLLLSIGIFVYPYIIMHLKQLFGSIS